MDGPGLATKSIPYECQKNNWFRLTFVLGKEETRFVRLSSILIGINQHENSHNLYNSNKLNRVYSL